MARRASPTLIGAFVMGAVVLALGAVFVLGGRQWFKRPVTCVMAFDGSVAGLTVGAPVLFRGVSLGAVSDIELRHGGTQIIVVGEIEPSRIQGLRPNLAPAEVGRVLHEAVQKGLRAQLQLQSLITGQLYVGLDYSPETPARLTGTDQALCEIPTIPTTLAQVQDQMKKIVAELEQLPLKQTLQAAARAGDAIEKIVASPEIPRVLRAADRTMQETQALARRLNAELGPAVGSLRVTLVQAQRTMDEIGGDVRRLVQDMDARVGPLAGSLGASADSAQALMREGQRTLRRLDDEIGPTLAALRGAADAAGGAMHRAEDALGQAGGLLDGNSSLGYQVAQALEELTRTAQALRGLSEDLERQPNLLLFGRGGRNP